MTEPTYVNPWTEENVALLRKLWAEGYPASYIAGSIQGTTRNSVIGKVHRIGLPMRSPGRRVRAEATPRKPREKKPRDIVLTIRATKNEPAWKTLPMPAERTPPETLYTLVDRPDNGCMYFYGDPRKEPKGYCGKPREVSLPYCPECARLCFDVRTPNERTKARQEREKVAA